jgi:hypothetical protein
MYSESERAVFGPYFNGERLVYADPLAVYRALTHELDGEPNKHLENLKAAEEPVQFAAKERVLVAARKALGMVPFDDATGKGSLEQDVMAALTAYTEWMEKKSSNTGSGLISQPPTVPVSSPAP